MKYEAVVIGVSAGGLHALTALFSELSAKFKLPIMIVQHMHAESDDYLARHLGAVNKLNFKETEEKELIRNGNVYIAPANYHMMVEPDRTLSLTIDQKVNFCRPSVDVLFESAVDTYREKLIGILLTGANSDGAQGMKMLRDAGGLTIVQDPDEAEVDSMPKSALKIFKPNYILNLKGIAKLLGKLSRTN